MMSWRFPDDELETFQTSWRKSEPIILIVYLSFLCFPDELTPLQMSWHFCRRAGPVRNESGEEGKPTILIVNIFYVFSI